MSLLSSIVGIFTGRQDRKASTAASNAEIEAGDRAIAEGRRQFDLSRADQLPFLQAGQAALGQQQGVLGAESGLLGLNGAGPQAEAIAQLKASPMWQSLFGAGEEAILANASATGGLRGGNTQHSLATFGRDTLAQLIERQLASYGALSGQYGAIAGQGAATGENLGALGANSATNIGKLQIGQGQAQSGGILARRQSSQGVTNSFMDTFGELSSLAKLFV